MLTNEERLRRQAAARTKLRWRADLDEIILAGAGGAHSVIEYRYDRDVEQAHGLPTAAKQVRFTKPDGTRGYRDRYYEGYGVGQVVPLGSDAGEMAFRVRDGGTRS